MLPNSRPRSLWQVNLLSLGLVSFASFLTSLTQGGDRDRDAQTLAVISKDDGLRRVEQIELSNLELLSILADKSATR